MNIYVGGRGDKEKQVGNVTASLRARRAGRYKTEVEMSMHTYYSSRVPSYIHMHAHTHTHTHIYIYIYIYMHTYSSVSYGSRTLS